MWITSLLLFVCLFVGLRISPPRIKLAANCARRFIGVQGRESSIFVNFVPPEAQNRTNRRAREPCPVECKVVSISVEMRDVNVTLKMRCSRNIVRRVDVESACVDRGQSPLTYLLLYYSLLTNANQIQIHKSKFISRSKSLTYSFILHHQLVVDWCDSFLQGQHLHMNTVHWMIQLTYHVVLSLNMLF